MTKPNPIGCGTILGVNDYWHLILTAEFEIRSGNSVPHLVLANALDDLDEQQMTQEHRDIVRDRLTRSLALIQELNQSLWLLKRSRRHPFGTLSADSCFRDAIDR